MNTAMHYFPLKLKRSVVKFTKTLVCHLPNLVRGVTEPGVALGSGMARLVARGRHSHRGESEVDEIRRKTNTQSYSLQNVTALEDLPSPFYRAQCSPRDLGTTRVPAPCYVPCAMSFLCDPRYVPQHTPWRWPSHTTGLRRGPSTPPATRYPLTWLMQR